MRRCLVPWLCLAVAFALAACGDDDDDGAGRDAGATATETTEAGGATSVDVTETEFEIDPANPRIDRPGTVTFRVRNAGRVPHALEVEGPTGEVETDVIDAGASATLRVDLSRPGTYEWYCPVGDHESRGMKGEITVAGGGAGASADHSDRRHDDSSTEGDSTAEDDSGKDDSGKDDSGKGEGGSGEGDGDSGNDGSGGSGGY